MRAAVHIEPVVTHYLCDEQIVVGLLDEFVLAFLKCIRFVLGNPLPTSRKFSAAGGRDSGSQQATGKPVCLTKRVATPSFEAI